MVGYWALLAMQQIWQGDRRHAASRRYGALWKMSGRRPGVGGKSHYQAIKARGSSSSSRPNDSYLVGNQHSPPVNSPGWPFERVEGRGRPRRDTRPPDYRTTWLMRWLIDFSVRRPVAIAMVYSALALLAWAAWANLPVDVVRGIRFASKSSFNKLQNYTDNRNRYQNFFTACQSRIGFFPEPNSKTGLRRNRGATIPSPFAKPPRPYPGDWSADKAWRGKTIQKHNKG